VVATILIATPVLGAFASVCGLKEWSCCNRHGRAPIDAIIGPVSQLTVMSGEIFADTEYDSTTGVYVWPRPAWVC
jgi:hypothetical protein